MHLAPYHKQTLVSSYSSEQVLGQIRDHTKLLKEDPLLKEHLFNGIVEDNSFRVSLAVTYSQNALPLASGTVEDTSRGSIIFLYFKLFPAALLYLTAFTMMSLFIGLVFLILAKSIVATIIAIVLALANYLILNINFHRKVEESIKAFKVILDPDN